MLKNDIDNMLAKMHQASGVEKGTPGEQAAFEVCKDLYMTYGGILIHSYEYKTDPDLPGNIKKNGQGFYLERLGPVTEIDILYVSPFNIFPIEVKAYQANKITLTDKGISGCNVTNKSPIHQNEMHTRHLYSFLFKSIPNGETKYITPIVCFVDKAKIIDSRTEWQRDYIKISVLNNLKSVIMNNDNCKGYRLNLESVEGTLKEQMSSSRIFLSRREY